MQQPSPLHEKFSPKSPNGVLCYPLSPPLNTGSFAQAQPPPEFHANPPEQPNKMPWGGSVQSSGAVDPTHQISTTTNSGNEIPHLVTNPDLEAPEYCEKDECDEVKPAKKKFRGTGRKKIEIALIPDKMKRQVTFSKRKKGLMKKIHELVTLTHAEGFVVLVSETSHVYSYATQKFVKLVSNPENNIIVKYLDNEATH